MLSIKIYVFLEIVKTVKFCLCDYDTGKFNSFCYVGLTLTVIANRMCINHIVLLKLTNRTGHMFYFFTNIKIFNI